MHAATELVDFQPRWLFLCDSAALVEGAAAVPFAVQYLGQPARAFAIRYQGQTHAYLNRCTHVPMEMDWQPNQVFDASGRWLLCATHGAMYRPQTGDCVGGPCRGGLVKIELREADGQVQWCTQPRLQAPEASGTEI